jgi:hypothetical protein
MSEQLPPEIADCDHDWEYRQDWSGDPEVINGTFTVYWKECRVCGEQEPWDGRMQPPDADDRLEPMEDSPRE